MRGEEPAFAGRANHVRSRDLAAVSAKAAARRLCGSAPNQSLSEHSATLLILLTMLRLKGRTIGTRRHNFASAVFVYDQARQLSFEEGPRFDADIQRQPCYAPIHAGPILSANASKAEIAVSGASS